MENTQNSYIATLKTVLNVNEVNEDNLILKIYLFHYGTFY